MPVALACELDRSYLGLYGDPCCDDSDCSDGYQCTREYEYFWQPNEPGICDFEDNDNYEEKLCYFEDGDSEMVEMKTTQNCEDVGMLSEEPEHESDLCGNGKIDPGEECDTGNLDGYSCLTIDQAGSFYSDYTGGELSCSDTCTFDTSDCVEETSEDAIEEGDWWEGGDQYSDCEDQDGECAFTNPNMNEYEKVNLDCPQAMQNCYMYDGSERGTIKGKFMSNPLGFITWGIIGAVGIIVLIPFIRSLF